MQFTTKDLIYYFQCIPEYKYSWIETNFSQSCIAWIARFLNLISWVVGRLNGSGSSFLHTRLKFLQVWKFFSIVLISARALAHRVTSGETPVRMLRAMAMRVITKHVVQTPNRKIIRRQRRNVTQHRHVWQQLLIE